MQKKNNNTKNCFSKVFIPIIHKTSVHADRLFGIIVLFVTAVVL